MKNLSTWAGYDDWLTQKLPEDEPEETSNEAIDSPGIRGRVAEAEDAGCDKY